MACNIYICIYIYIHIYIRFDLIDLIEQGIYGKIHDWLASNFVARARATCGYIK